MDMDVKRVAVPQVGLLPQLLFFPANISGAGSMRRVPPIFKRVSKFFEFLKSDHMSKSYSLLAIVILEEN